MTHKFWSTQPVTDPSSNSDDPEGVILKVNQDIRSTPYGLPEEFDWELLEVFRDSHLDKTYELLSKFYVEGEARLLYTKDFLNWFFSQKDAICLGVKVSKTGKLVGFIFASFGKLCIKGITVLVAEIDFLCVHPKLRNKRLAPMLIKEITRRVRLRDIHCAVYTAGVELPTPYVKHQYHHRFINVDKLFAVGFISADQIPFKDTYKRKCKVPAKWHSSGIHEANLGSTDLVCKDIIRLFESKDCLVKPVLSVNLIRHMLSAPGSVLQTFYITDPDSGDMVAFCMVYYLQYVFGTKTMRVAQLHHHAARNENDLRRLLKGTLAKIRNKADVLNVLDGADFIKVKEILDLTPGTGTLFGYLWNYRLATVDPQSDGVLLF